MLVGSSETIRRTSYWDDEIVRSIWRHMVQYDRFLSMNILQFKLGLHPPLDNNR